MVVNSKQLVRDIVQCFSPDIEPTEHPEHMRWALEILGRYQREPSVADKTQPHFVMGLVQCAEHLMIAERDSKKLSALREWGKQGIGAAGDDRYAAIQREVLRKIEELDKDLP